MKPKSLLRIVACFMSASLLVSEIRAQEAPASLPKVAEVVASPVAAKVEVAAKIETSACSTACCTPCFSALGLNGGERVNVYGLVDQGFTYNSRLPHDKQNFGRLFDDRANDYRFNQAVVGFERCVDHDACRLDWGFKAEFMYGSDARFTHSLGFMDNVTRADVQPEINELYAVVHLPGLTRRGMDLKVGQFIPEMGAERIFALDNPLYSHSYIFNGAILFHYTGAHLNVHVTPQFDVHAAVVTGVNTGTFDDNNNAPAWNFGFNWKSEKERFRLAGAVHTGPENPSSNEFVFGIRRRARNIFALTATADVNDNLTAVTDFHLSQDHGFQVEAYGVAQYFVYKLNCRTSLVMRLEIFRDDDGFFIGQFAENDDLIDLERGDFENLDPRTVSGGAATYTSLTLGVNQKIRNNLIIRPEVRWDWSAGGTAPFIDSTRNNQFTIGIDAIWKF